MLNESKQLNFWDKIMMAITFAEAGESDTARDILNKRQGKQQRPENKNRKEVERRPELKL